MVVVFEPAIETTLLEHLQDLGFVAVEPTTDVSLAREHSQTVEQQTAGLQIALQV